MKRIVSLAAASVAGLLLSLSASAGGFLIKAGLSNSNMDLNHDIATVISHKFFNASINTGFVLLSYERLMRTSPVATIAPLEVRIWPTVPAHGA